MATVRQVRRSRVLPAPRDRVWRLLTEPTCADVWLGAAVLATRAPGAAPRGEGPGPGPVAADDVPGAPLDLPTAPDLRTPGNRGVLVEADGTTRQVVVDEVVPGRRLVLHWRGDRGHATEPSRVEIALEDADEGGTRLTVTEAALADLVCEAAG